MLITIIIIYLLAIPVWLLWQYVKYNRYADKVQANHALHAIALDDYYALRVTIYTALRRRTAERMTKFWLWPLWFFKDTRTQIKKCRGHFKTNPV